MKRKKLSNDKVNYDKVNEVMTTIEIEYGKIGGFNDDERKYFSSIFNEFLINYGWV